MILKHEIPNVLFLDIETVREFKEYEQLNPVLQKCWDKKMKSKKSEEESFSEMYSREAGLYSEFGKIACIAFGLVRNSVVNSITLSSIAGDDEKELLLKFKEIIEKHFHGSAQKYVCGHNIKEFDIPYIVRRMIIHKIPLPAHFKIYDKKSWEIKFMLDTMEFWKMGEFKSHASLELLSGILGIESPKDDIDGSMVGNVFWNEMDFKRIAHYCENDVIATAQVFLRLIEENLIEKQNIYRK